jgi:Protein of unknown function (DUF3605)
MASTASPILDYRVDHQIQSEIGLQNDYQPDSGSDPKAPILPYWQQNLPPALRPSTCPAFLQNLSAKDISILSTLDAAYHVLSWADVRSLIASNRIDLFQRRPSDLRRYLEFNWRCKQTHGSVLAFILSQKLCWMLPVSPRADTPFASPDDISVRHNDWPYGIDPKIVHLIVWTKFELPDDPDTGLLTDCASASIDAYVKETFVSRLGEENVGRDVVSFLKGATNANETNYR